MPQYGRRNYFLNVIVRPEGTSESFVGFPKLKFRRSSYTDFGLQGTSDSSFPPLLSIILVVLLPRLMYSTTYCSV